MKRELERTVKQLCREAGSAAAAAKEDELKSDLAEQYEQRIQAGMSELDAYRDVLKNVDQIRAMLLSLPKSEAEEEQRKSKEEQKRSEKILDKISSCLWIGTLIAYFLISFGTGLWAYTWLIFLWSSIGQNILDMVKKLGRGKPKKKVLRSGLSSILWIGVVILYFIVSFGSGLWHLTWLLFPAATLVQILMGLFLGE